MNPGTVSNIVWHFTGGPEWDDKLQKQGNILKSDELAYKALKSIVSSKELRIGRYKEIFRSVIPIKRLFDSITKKIIESKNVPVELESEKICCVAEIPIQHLAFHSKRYGRFAIGFYRDSVIRSGFNPVLYSLNVSELSRAIYESVSTLDSIDTLNIENATDDIQFELDNVIEDNPEEGSFDPIRSSVEDLKTEISNLDSDISTSKDGYKRLLAFIKTFSRNEFNSIYCEREWRSLEQFNFTFNDIAFIVLPKNGNSINYFNDFTNEYANKIEIPRTIPIIPWEDLIEY